MPVKPPSAAQIEEIADDLGLHLSAVDVRSYRALLAPLVRIYDVLDALPDELPPVRYPRTPGVRPEPEDNPLGAWYVRTHIEGAPQGPLRGRTVALKDNVMLAGVQMMNGTSTLEGYIPPVDATIVTRILDAGGTIAGKAVCEAYCFSAGSHTSATGPVHNPHRHGYSAGGSSSGSAALVAAGEVDMAIGGDQGGSIRIPASLCGACGMKPTHGLVPYSGVLGIEPTIDHVGPITRCVADNALLLEVIAGADGLDGRQCNQHSEPYSVALEQGVEGLRVGVLEEGFGHDTSERGVDEKVRAAADRLARLGAKTSQVSVPLHHSATAIGLGIFQSAVHTVLDTDGCGTGREDLYVQSYVDFHRRWRERADELPETLKTYLLLLQHVTRHHGHHYYAKAMNLVRRLRRAYDEAFEQVDVLVMPTTPTTARPLPPPDAPREAILAAAFAPAGNTQAFDHTHHPALSVPCGLCDGLPVGLMLVGRAYEESTLYRAARALERDADWREL